jgi:hypothetical protein
MNILDLSSLLQTWVGQCRAGILLRDLLNMLLLLLRLASSSLSLHSDVQIPLEYAGEIARAFKDSMLSLVPRFLRLACDQQDALFGYCVHTRHRVPKSVVNVSL